MLASPLTFVFKERSQLYLLDSALLLLFQFNDLSLALAAAPCLRGQILKQLAIVQPTFKIVCTSWAKNIGYVYSECGTFLCCLIVSTRHSKETSRQLEVSCVVQLSSVCS